MRYFLFSAWNENCDGYKEILVIAKSIEEAKEKIFKDSKYQDYSFEEEMVNIN